VAGAANLLDIRMLSAKVDLEKVAPGDDLTFELDIQQKVEREEDADFFAVRGTFSVEIYEIPESDESDNPRSDVASVTFEYAALYGLSDLGDYAPTNEEFQAYAETAGTFALYPYAREFITNVTSRLGLPPLVIQTLKLPSPWHDGDAQD